MSLQIHTNSESGVKRQEYFMVSPEDIVILEELRGRRFPPTDEAIIKMAMSLFDNTQLQPIECRRQTIGGNKNTLVATSGFTRANAIRLIRKGFTGTDGVERVDPEMGVKVVVKDCSDKEAFIHNIVENQHRNDVSDIDDAHNQNKMRERYGLNDTEIAKIYQYKTSNKVGRLRQLLQLSDSEQLLVHTGLLSTQAALDLLELDPEKRAEVIAACQQGDETTKINGAKIQDAVRELILNDNNVVTENEGATIDVIVAVEGTANEGSKKSTPKFKPRTMSNLRKFLDATVADEKTDPAVVRFVGDLQKWLGGRVGDQAMLNAFKRILEAEPTPKIEVASEVDSENASE